MNDLVSGNKTFVARSVEKNADYFKSLAAGQSPDTLWLGCSDSRIPEATIADKGPGDIFVHRNIANIIKTGDLSAESAIEFAVRHLKVKKVVVCGHSRCGGAMASLGDADLGHSLNTWLEPLRELRKSHQEDINKLASADEKALQLAKLNVASSIAAVKAHSAVKEAIAERGLSVHGTIFHLETGTLEVLKQ